MFNSYFGKSYIDLRNQRRIYVAESLSTLNDLMSDQSDEISVHKVSSFRKETIFNNLKKMRYFKLQFKLKVHHISGVLLFLLTSISKIFTI